MTPRCTCTTPYFASAAMNRRSHCNASVIPTPMAWPFTAAITGLRTCQASKRTAAASKVVRSISPNV